MRRCVKEQQATRYMPIQTLYKRLVRYCWHSYKQATTILRHGGFSILNPYAKPYGAQHQQLAFPIPVSSRSWPTHKVGSAVASPMTYRRLRSNKTPKRIRWRVWGDCAIYRAAWLSITMSFISVNKRTAIMFICSHIPLFLDDDLKDWMASIAWQLCLYIYHRIRQNGNCRSIAPRSTVTTGHSQCID